MHEKIQKFLLKIRDIAKSQSDLQNTKLFMQTHYLVVCNFVAVFYPHNQFALDTELVAQMALIYWLVGDKPKFAAQASSWVQLGDVFKLLPWQAGEDLQLTQQEILAQKQL